MRDNFFHSIYLYIFIIFFRWIFLLLLCTQAVVPVGRSVDAFEQYTQNSLIDHNKISAYYSWIHDVQVRQFEYTTTILRADILGAIQQSAYVK